MGLEYIVQPQIFLGGLTALGPGIQGLTEQYPLLTTYYSWTSTASVDTSSFPIPIAAGSIYNGPGKEASFIVSVGNVIQSPTEYTVDPILRTITFSSVVSAGIEFAATQLATAAPSSQNFDYVKSVSAEFITLTATNGSFNNLVVTNLTALSTTVNVIDIRISEVSGFRATGDVDVFGSVNVTNNINLTGSLVAANITSTSLTSTNITSTSLTSTFITTNILSAREIDLVHTPANDGVDPILDIGETTTDGFSGIRVRYEESTNRLLVQTVASSLTSNSVIIDRATGQVGISAIPNQALTVTGNISATGSLFAGPGTTALAPITLLSGGPLTIAQPGSIERGQYGFFATPAGSQRGIITAPQTFLLNADRTGPTGTTTFSIFGVGCNLAVGKYGYRIVFTATKTSANASQIQYALTTTSGTISSHYYQVLGNTAAAVTTLAAPQQMSNYITTNFSTLVTVTVAGAAAASSHNTIIDGILDISADVVGLNPQLAFTAIPTTSLIKAGSYIQIWPLGSATNANVSVGSWA